MNSILTPVLALIVWSLLVLIWLYVRRIPAIRRSAIEARTGEATEELQQMRVMEQRVASNYNHLMEQPTIFYAIVFYIFLAGHVDLTQIFLAWAYVALRVVHSLIQGTINVPVVRFSVFVVSSLVLTVLVGREVFALL